MGALPRSARLDLPDKLRQESIRRQVDLVRRGERPEGPVVVELDLTTFCDLGCPECISASLLHTTAFDGDRLVALVDEMAGAGVRAIILIGGGEPLVHPRATDVIRRAAEHDIAVGLTTNGTQLHRHLEAVADCASWTRVSVDAATAETYGTFRPSRGGRPPQLDAVVRNMRLLAERKRGSLGFSYLLIARRDGDGRVVEHNFGEVAAAAALARGIGCDYFEVKPEYDMQHYLRSQPAGLRAALDDQLEGARELDGPGFEVIGPRHLANVLGGRPLTQPKEYASCPTTGLRTLVTPTGMYACPYHRGNPQAKIADVRVESFADAWVRGSQTDVDPSRSCGFNCIRHESNVALLGDEPLETVPDYDLFI